MRRGLAAPGAREKRGRNRWNAVACLRASWYLLVTALMVGMQRLTGFTINRALKRHG